MISAIRVFIRRLSARLVTPCFVTALCGFCLTTTALPAGAGNANRLAYLDAPIDPYYVGRGFARLVTPQWVGADDVDAVVILAIDDMRAPARYEAYLRPILDRLKAHQGRAALSIMTNQVDPQDAQLAAWLREGVNIDVHTIDHPCPLLCESDFEKAKQTYNRCVDLMNQIEGNRPTAFRMPCCDSMNSPSPRFYSEVFQGVTKRGNFLTLDSSVFTVITDQDDTLPELVAKDAAGQSRFRKYLPFPSFVNTIEDYPYPYVIGHICWEFPCIVPSDWEAQNIQQPNNPRTVEDLQIALDAIVHKKGVMNLVFHPHGWIRNDQVVQLIDYAAATYGQRVRFLNFSEAQQLIDQHLLGGTPLRDPKGDDQGVRLLDVDNDGYLDVIRHTKGTLSTRIWRPEQQQWQEFMQPLEARSLHFGVMGGDGRIGLMAVTSDDLQLWEFAASGWERRDFTVASDGVSKSWQKNLANPQRLDAVQWRDFDGQEGCELLLARGADSLILRQQGEKWEAQRFGLPPEVRLTRDEGGDAGVRWIDLDGDGRDECLFSDPERFSVHRFASWQQGWQIVVQSQRNELPVGVVNIPPFVRPDGSNNGMWAHSEHLWWQNEDTARLPDKVDRVPFSEILSAANHAPSADASGFPGPLEPQQALHSFRSSVQADIQLVAAEPLVTDPVAFDWAPDGRLFVVQMGDYPEGDSQSDTPSHDYGGRVRVLIDDDQDGRYDRAETFLDGLQYPSAIKVWRGGVLVAAAPEVIWAEDTDGDLRADKRRVLYRGFHEGNPQHLINGLRWGIDNWLYLANGDSGGDVESFAGGETIALRGRDLRIQPDSGLMEALSGQTQYGRARDDLGNWFGGNNSEPLWHYVLDDRYLRRNAHFAPPAVRRLVPEFPGPAPIFPASRTLPRFNDFDRADRFTSACGPVIVPDSGFEPAGSVESFVCEPVHNMIHREVLTADGISFRSHRAAVDRAAEFLASTDNWFRPVLARIGPDGAIWVADMYRLVIEHPEWIPQHWQQQLDLRAGQDRGRIYRVAPAGRAAEPFPRLDTLSTEQLVQRLDHPNRWQRDTAQQMLLWQADKAAVEPLRKLVQTADRPIAKMQALYTLDGLQAIDDSWLADLIRHGDAAVVRHALVIAEPRLANHPELTDSVLSRVETTDRPLQLQLAYTLGYCLDPRAADALADLATRPPSEPAIEAAVISSLRPDNVQQVTARMATQHDVGKHLELFGEMLGQCLALGDENVHATTLRYVVEPTLTDNVVWRWQQLAEMLDTYLRHHDDLQQLPPDVIQAIEQQVGAARHRVTDPDADLALRQSAIGLLRADVDPDQQNLDALQALLEPRQPAEIQAKAGEVLLQRFSEQAMSPLLTGWSGFTPQVRSRLLSEILARTDLTVVLLRSAREQQLDLQLDARRRQQLLSANDARVRTEAEALFADATSSSREEIIAAYRPSENSLGDAEQGRQTFQRVCASCHQFAGMGHAVGPDLEALSNKSVDFLLTSILDPNRAVEANYLDFYVETSDGRQTTGMLRGETANSITLLAAEAKHQSVLRKDIEYMQATGKSLMPEGLEKDITTSQMHDLFAFLRSYQPPRKTFAGNQPQIAPGRDDGSIRLLAMHAEIYGPTLVFEEQYRNLGFWGSPQDFAAWTVQLPEPREFTVSVEYAFPDPAVGNRFVITCENEQLVGEVSPSGSWDQYRWARIGTLRLPAGRSRIVMQADGPLQEYLLDLHQILLSPVD